MKFVFWSLKFTFLVKWMLELKHWILKGQSFSYESAKVWKLFSLMLKIIRLLRFCPINVQTAIMVPLKNDRLLRLTAFKRNWGGFKKRFETKLWEAHWIFKLLFFYQVLPWVWSVGYGFALNIMSCTVLPINTQGCKAFSWNPPWLRLSAQQQASGSCSGGERIHSWEAWAASWPPKCGLYCTAILFTTEGWHTMSLLCILAILWRQEAGRQNLHTQSETLVFYFMLLLVCWLAAKD